MPLKRKPRPESDPSIDIESQFYTDVELAAYYRVSRNTIWTWAKNGLIEKLSIGRVTRFRRVPETAK